MKTGLRNLSYAIIIFTSIYSFFAEQIIGATSTYNYSIVLNILNISNIFNMAYGSFGNYIEFSYPMYSKIIDADTMKNNELSE